VGARADVGEDLEVILEGRDVQLRQRIRGQCGDLNRNVLNGFFAPLGGYDDFADRQTAQ
jgi:hypothetical protein